MLIRNKSNDAREIAVGDFSAYVEPGETVEVPDEVANGTPATGEKGGDGEIDPTLPGYHPGVSGLLDQDGIWEKASAPKRKPTDETPAAGEEA